MQKKILLIIFTNILLLLGTLYSFAQTAQWKVGDKVEVKNSPANGFPLLSSKSWIGGNTAKALLTGL